MTNEIITAEDLVWIEMELRGQAYHPGYDHTKPEPFPNACTDCNQRLALADKISRVRDGMPVLNEAVQRRHTEEYQKREDACERLQGAQRAIRYGLPIIGVMKDLVCEQED